MARPPKSRYAPGCGVVVVGDDHPPTSKRQPRVILVLVALVAGVAAGYLLGVPKGDPRPVPTGELRATTVLPASVPPEASLVQELAAAFAAGDSERLVVLLDDDPTVLQWPGSFETQGTFEGSIQEVGAFYIALDFRLTLSDCRLKRLRSRDAGLYDGMVTCAFWATDRLAELLGGEPERGWMDFGVRNGAIRGAVVRETEEKPETAQRAFRNWMETYRPHENAHWLGDRGRHILYGEDTAHALLRLADEYLAWVALPDSDLSPLRPAAGDTSPSYRAGHTMDYDAAAERVLLFGGFPYDLWAYDHDTRSWSQLVEKAPPAKVPAAVFDVQSDLLVVVGSDWETETTNVLTYDLTAGIWEMKGNGPMYRDSWWSEGWLRAVYDADSDRVVAATNWGRFWAYDADEDRWTERLDPWSGWPPVSLEGLAEERPPCVGWLSERPMAYDSGSDLVVLAGRGDLCVYDVDTDTLTIRRTGDAPQQVSAIGYDVDSDRIVILGDRATWSYHTPSGLLERIGPVDDGLLWRNAAMAYHRGADRMVVFDGGSTWIYDLDTNSWTALQP